MPGRPAADRDRSCAAAWQVTGVDIGAAAIARAWRRAEAAGVQVHWVVGDVGGLGGLGLEPGYALLCDSGCIQELPDGPARARQRG